MEKQKETIGKKALKRTKRAAAWTIEKLVSELALVGAAFSATSDGNYLSKLYTGAIGPAKAIGYGAVSLIKNDGIRDVASNYAVGAIQGLGNAADNIVNHPTETLLAAATTFGLYKGIPYASKKIREKLRKRD